MYQLWNGSIQTYLSSTYAVMWASIADVAFWVESC